MVLARMHGEGALIPGEVAVTVVVGIVIDRSTTRFS